MSTIIPKYDGRQNWQKLGMSSSQLLFFQTYVAQWNILFKLYSNENSCSPAIESELIGIQIKLTEFIEQFPDLVSAMENRSQK